MARPARRPDAGRGMRRVNGRDLPRLVADLEEEYHRRTGVWLRLPKNASAQLRGVIRQSIQALPGAPQQPQPAPQLPPLRDEDVDQIVNDAVPDEEDFIGDLLAGLPEPQPEEEMEPVLARVGVQRRAQVSRDEIDPAKYYAMVLSRPAGPAVWAYSSLVGYLPSGEELEASEDENGQTVFDLAAAVGELDLFEVDIGPQYFVSEITGKRCVRFWSWATHARPRVDYDTFASMFQEDEMYGLYVTYFEMGDEINNEWSPMELDKEGLMELSEGGGRKRKWWRGDSATGGQLYGADKFIRDAGGDKGYHLGWILVAAPMPAPDAGGEIGPAYQGDGEFANCAIRAVVNQLRKKTQDDSGQRGTRAKLTPKRMNVLRELDAKLAGTGFCEKDIAEVERRLDIVLHVVDAQGDVLWNSSRPLSYQDKRTKVTVTYNAHHIFAEFPMRPPPATTCHRELDEESENEMAALLRELDEKTEKGWEGDRARVHAAMSIRFDEKKRDIQLKAAGKLIRPDVRVWMTDSALVTSDGHIYRSKYDAGLFLEAHEKHFPGQDPTEQERMMSGPHGLALRSWKERNTLRPTPNWCREEWSQSQVEAEAWNCKKREEHTHHIDIRCAYGGAGENAAGECQDLVDRYGWPTGSGIRRGSIDPPFDLAATKSEAWPDWAELTGIVRMKSWRFSDETHEATVFQLQKHFEKKGWITLPELADLVDSNELVEAVVDTISWVMNPKQSLEFPAAGGLDQASRNDTVHFIGSCARTRVTTTIVTNDAAEANWLCHKNAATQTLLSIENQPNIHVITIESEDQPTQYLGVRSYTLAYTNISLRRMLRRYPRDDVIGVQTDAIFSKGKDLPAAVESMLVKNNDNIRYGQWREKKGVFLWCEHRWAEPIRHGTNEKEAPPAKPVPCRRTLETTPGARLDGVPDAFNAKWVAGRQFVFARGGGGSGKSYDNANFFRERSVLLLAPTRELVEDHQKNYPFATVKTYHSAFALPVTKPIEDWNPEELANKLANLPEVIIMDEIATVQRAVLKRLLEYLATTNRTVIMCGDYGQMVAFGDKDAAENERWLISRLGELDGVLIPFDGDMRSLDDHIRQMKKDMHYKDDQTQIEIMRRELPLQAWEAVEQEWNPDDYVVAATHRLVSAATASLLRVQKEKFPDRPVRISFRPERDLAKRLFATSGARVKIPGSEEEVEAMTGRIAHVAMAVVERGLDPAQGWVLAIASTLHSFQGKTVKDPTKLFIIDSEHYGHDFLANGPYVAVSRVRRFEQLRRTAVPVEDATPRPDQLIMPAYNTLVMKIRGYIGQDRTAFLNGCKTRELKRDEAVTPRDLLKLVADQQGLCAACGRFMVFTGQNARDPAQFTVDRVNDKLPHTASNVVLSCLGCNQKHRPVRKN